MPPISAAETSFARLTDHLASHFETEIVDFRSIARLHGLEIGAPAHLASLPMRLSQDGRLRSDFSEMIRALQARDSEFSLADALTVLTLAVGGVASFAPRPDLDEPKSLLGGFLSTLGHWPGADNQPITDLDNPPDHDPRLDLQAEARAEALLAREAAHQTAGLPVLPPDDDEPEPPTDAQDLQAVNALTQTPDPASDPEAHRQSLEALTLSRITDVLARLERGNLELRLHLDSIDQRISRMEPLLESVPHHTETAANIPEPASPTPPRPTSTSPAPAEAPLVHRDQRAPVVSPVPQAPSPSQSASPQTNTPPAGRLSLHEAAPTSPPHDPDRRLALEPLVAPEAITAAQTANPQPDKPAAIPAPARPATGATRQPRRDRFAAARELPGFQNEVLDRPSVDLLEPEPEAPAPPSVAPDPDLLRPVPRTPAPSVTTAAEPTPPTPVVSTPTAGTPAQTPPVPNLFSSIGSSTTAADIAADDPPSSRRGAILGTVAVLLLLLIASFVFVYGSPLPLLDRLLHPDSTPAASAPPQTTSATQPRSPATAPRATTKPSPSQATPNAAPSGRVLGAREAFTPTESTEETVQSTEAPTFVPEAVMDGHLLSAPHPIYPRLANIVGVRGRVVFEAMISKDGAVESLRALGGSRLLRDSASNAVRQWEYRPFVVKGEPVEVRTIIRVDVDPDSTE